MRDYILIFYPSTRKRRPYVALLAAIGNAPSRSQPIDLDFLQLSFIQPAYFDLLSPWCSDRYVFA